MIHQRKIWSTITAGILFSLVIVECFAAIEPFEADSRIPHMAEEALDTSNKMNSQDPKTVMEGIVEYVKMDQETREILSKRDKKKDKSSRDSSRDSSTNKETSNDIDRPNSQDCR